MRNFTKKEILEATKDSYGIISTIAHRLNCDWTTAKKYINKYKDTQIAYDNENETILDLAESKLYERINEKDVSCIKFLLSTKGKNRGYSEKQEIEHSGNKENPLGITLVINDTIKGSNGNGNGKN